MPLPELVTPAPDAGFIEDPERQTRRADLPFQKVWVEPGVDFKRYRALIVAPVNTQHMLKMDWLHKTSSAEWLGNVKADIKELAQYFRDQVVKDFHRIPITASTSMSPGRIGNRRYAWSSP